MNPYRFEFRFRMVLLICALLIISATLWYSNLLAKKLAFEERKRMQLLANTYERLNNVEDGSDYTFLLDIIQDNKTVPLILTDKEFNIAGSRNFDSIKSLDSSYMKRELRFMLAKGDTIGIKYQGKTIQYICYKDSTLLSELKYYPYVQLLIICIFLAVAYFAFFSSQRSIQNQLWVGMAKETAHQIATPLSSLGGWVDYLAEKEIPATIQEKVLPEMNHDLERLSIITDRFSKIGSQPELVIKPISESVSDAVNYMKRRAPSKVQIELKDETNMNVLIAHNPSLMNWVFENLIRNALDAMSESGTINVRIQRENKAVIIDVQDSGKGMEAKDFKNVFKPGFSTKKRGWGIGLALCKRIVEDYHKGSIEVLNSEIGKGTTFRIQLPA
jgi:signal transduction histidine kinase